MKNNEKIIDIDDKYFQICDLLMLKSYNKTKLYYNYPTEDLRFDDKCTGISGANEYYNLYVLSNDELKVGDFYFYKHLGESTILKVEENDSLEDLNNPDVFSKKIIATTNFEIQPIPRINNSSINKFLELYNSGDIANRVIVEYMIFCDRICSCNHGVLESEIYVPVINPVEYSIDLDILNNVFTKNDLQFLKNQSGNHLKFIYNRMIEVHNENPNYDYMLKLKQISDWVDKYI